MNLEVEEKIENEGSIFAKSDKQLEFNTFVEKEIIPNTNQYDQTQRLPKILIDKIANCGYLGATLPHSFSGQEMDPITFGNLCEEIAAGSFSVLSLMIVHGMVSEVILKWGSNEQKRRWLPKLATGKLIAALGLSEENIGSDLANIETTAHANKDYFIINGKKKWISCGQIADVFIILAKLADQPTAFLIEKNTPNFSIKPISGMLGFRAAMLAELNFQNCRIPKTNLMGQVGFGLSHIAATALDHGRYCVAWGCVGLGQACLIASLRYINQRKQFGVPLIDHQLVKRMITNMVADVKAARMLCTQAGNLKLASNHHSILETSIAKYFSSKMANKVATDAVQIHGANGCSSEYPIERYFRDAKIADIIEGSTQIQQLVIAQNVYNQFLFESSLDN